MELMQKIVPTTNQPVMLFPFFSPQTNGHSSEAVYQERLSRLENDKECLILQVCEPSSSLQPRDSRTISPSCAFLVITAAQKADSSVRHPQNTSVCVFQKLLEVCLTDGGCLVQIFSTCLFFLEVMVEAKFGQIFAYFYPCGGAEEVLFGFPCLLLAITP